MIFYILYRLGRFLAMRIPLKISYRTACSISDAHYNISRRDREAVVNNLKVVLGDSHDEEELHAIAKDVFRNFAKYLVDFFRFARVDQEYIKRSVKIDGLDNLKNALSKGKGAIILSAHIGNWELGALVISLLRYPLSAVVLSHQNKMINDFFTRQRSIGGTKPIEIGIHLRSCYRALKNNGLLALLGDRDFSKNGVYVDFFGKRTLIPKGPAVFSYRMGSAIVPAFMIREDDDTFRLVFEGPIYPNPEEDEKSEIISLTRRHLSVIESYIKAHPDQWFVFREVWNNNDKDMRPDTIV